MFTVEAKSELKSSRSSPNVPLSFKLTFVIFLRLIWNPGSTQLLNLFLCRWKLKFYVKMKLKFLDYLYHNDPQPPHLFDNEFFNNWKLIELILPLHILFTITKLFNNISCFTILRTICSVKTQSSLNNGLYFILRSFVWHRNIIQIMRPKTSETKRYLVLVIQLWMSVM